MTGFTTPSRQPGVCCSGFSLLELAVALVVVGLLATAAAAVYRPISGAARTQRALRLLDGIQQALIDFAGSHHRLPCADTNGDGFEGAATGCAGTSQTGAVPYATLGIERSGAPGDDAGLVNIVYGLYRNPGIDADLALAAERTGDLAGDPGFETLGDFRKALANAGSASVSNAFVYLTGVGANENCNTVVRSNAAFVLATAGAADANGDGNLFDGVNTALRTDGSGSKCFASPARRRDRNYDDLTRAVGFAALTGSLSGLD